VVPPGVVAVGGVGVPGVGGRRPGVGAGVPGVGAGVPGVGVVVGGVADPVVQTVLLSSLVSSVTAPLRASARPSTVEPVATVIEVNARTFPWNAVPEPIVAELPTCQKTLHGEAPLIRTTSWRRQS
jgi:hypothetical protein